MLCYRAPAPSTHGGAPEETWQTLLGLGAERYGARAPHAPVCVAEGRDFVVNPPRSWRGCASVVAAHGRLALAALYNLTHISGSLVIRARGSPGPLAGRDQAIAAAQSDELYQIERLGRGPTSTLRQENSSTTSRPARAFLALLENERLRG